jgi:hypothetical protein
LRYFLLIIRGIFLKGIGLEILWPQMAGLVFWLLTPDSWILYLFFPAFFSLRLVFYPQVLACKRHSRKMDSSTIHRRLIRILEAEDFEHHLQSLSDIPFPQLFRFLLSALCSREEKIKWRAVTTLGHWVARMAAEDMEAGRNAFRRLLWMLNEESGGSGWGVPEAMGDILARHEGLAREFAPILVSYARPDGNFLEYEPLQAGLAWAFGRLAEASPERLQSLHAHRYLIPYLTSANAGVRGMAAWALGRLGAKKDLGSLHALRGDEAPCILYENGRLIPRTVQDLVREAIARIEARSVPDR